MTQLAVFERIWFSGRVRIVGSPGMGGSTKSKMGGQAKKLEGFSPPFEALGGFSIEH